MSCLQRAAVYGVVPDPEPALCVCLLLAWQQAQRRVSPLTLCRRHAQVVGCARARACARPGDPAAVVS